MAISATFSGFKNLISLIIPSSIIDIRLLYDNILYFVLGLRNESWTFSARRRR